MDNNLVEVMKQALSRVIDIEEIVGFGIGHFGNLSKYFWFQFHYLVQDIFHFHSTHFKDKQIGKTLANLSRYRVERLTRKPDR